jgi:hypothetical protein
MTNYAEDIQNRIEHLVVRSYPQGVAPTKAACAIANRLQDVFAALGTVFYGSDDDSSKELFELEAANFCLEIAVALQNPKEHPLFAGCFPAGEKHEQ